MPPPKKAPKKAAKKAAGQHHDKHQQANDLRRAYEHMGRVAVLQQASKASLSESIAELSTLAQQEIKEGHGKGAADLLRASEHLSFAILAGEIVRASRVSAGLKASITEQFGDLMRKADEHWEEEETHSKTLTEIYKSVLSSATKTFKAGDYHQALEFARAAEALACVKQHGYLDLESGRKSPRLKSA